MSQFKPEEPQSIPANFRRNAIAFMGDWVSFGVGMSFVSASTVLPVLVNQLGGSPLAVGLISTIGSGGWLLPQLLAARYVSRLERKKPAIIVPSLIGRPTFLVTAVALLLLAPTKPQLALLIFFLGFTLFSVLDGVCSVPWFDLMSKAIPAHRRGRFIGAAQVISAVVNIGVGGVVAYVLGDASPFAYPTSYAVLFFLAAAGIGLSVAFISTMREPPGETATVQLNLRDMLGELKTVWKGDRDFRLISGTRLMLGLSMLSSPFYTVYAINNKGVPAAAVGGFLSAQIVGGFACSIVGGYILERYGSRVTTNTEVFLAAIPPTLAVVGGAFVPGNSIWFQIVYLLLFAMLGAMNNMYMLGHMNYVLEMSPEAKRPIYIGLSNTITGLLVVVPLLGGWLVEAISYEPLFALTALCIAPALALTIRLTEPRQRFAVATETIDA